MAKHSHTNTYEPDFVSPPGETLAETLQAKEMDQSEAAKRMGRSPKLINEIIKGKAPITPETAIQLERVLGVPAGFWNNRERHYREYLASKAESERLQTQVAWLKTIPLNAMVKACWMQKFTNKVAQLQEALDFFRIASPEEWKEMPEAAFRQSPAFKGDPTSVTAWLRRGENLAEEIYCSPYNLEQFKAAIKEIRGFTVQPIQDVTSTMIDLCAQAGVALVFVPQLPKTRVSGATRWLSPRKALIQLSLRYKTNDHFWFTFFHEAGHIILGHSKKEILINEDNGRSIDTEEEANHFAAEFLIPEKNLRNFLFRTKRVSKQTIIEFAKDIGIAPGILVGRLQHDQHLPHTHCNDLKVKFQWV